ncbi:unnamed protein product [Sphagnum jensenii]|uniref:Uncharacterized protein n=1 Tax=Sphagnum jensenii TaxID=128206 RepID=A0ABP0VP37_9BRYO
MAFKALSHFSLLTSSFQFSYPPTGPKIRLKSPFHVSELLFKVPLTMDLLSTSSLFYQSGETDYSRRFSTVPHASSAVDSSQRHVVITGGNAGIGKATAMELARRGMAVTIACRNKEKGEEAAAEIVRNTNDPSIRVMICDLASLTSVRQFAKEYLDQGLPLNSLVNNAGVMACPQQYTEDGFEYQLGVNHLGHFLLTALLLDRLKTSATPGLKSRVVVLSSAAERIGNLDFNDLNFKGPRAYERWLAYGQSKLANCLFSHELSRRCVSFGIPVTSNCMHPGIVDTQLIRYVFPQGISSNKPALFPGIRSTIIKLLGLKTPEEGASTAVFLASAPEMEGVTGGYYEDSRRKSPSARAVDSRLAYELWRVSEELTGATEALEPLQLSVLASNVLS